MDREDQEVHQVNLFNPNLRISTNLQITTNIILDFQDLVICMYSQIRISFEN